MALERFARTARRTSLFVFVGLAIAVAALLIAAFQWRSVTAALDAKRNEFDSITVVYRQELAQLRSARDSALRETESIVTSLSRTSRAAPFVRQGINHFQRGEDALAIQAYERAMALDPDNPQVLDFYGYVLIRAGRSEEAAAALRKSVRLSPTYARGWYNLAIAEWNIGNMDQAISSLRRVIALDPGQRTVIRGDPQFRRFTEHPEFRSLVRAPQPDQP